MTTRTFRIATLNIVMPSPHSPSRYVSLFQQALQLQKPVKLWGDFRGMLGSFSVEGGNATGNFYKFFDLNASDGWFNVRRREEAKPAELAQIRVPDHLKPHHQSIRFVFFPERHRLVFITKDRKESLTPRMAESLLEKLFADKAIVADFGEIDITVEPSREQLQKILSLPRLKALTIDVSPPNPDDLEKAELDVFKRMDQEHANRMKIELRSKHPEGLQPDTQHETLARVAQSNGKVQGRGEDENGKTVTLSTKTHPWIEPISYDTETQTRDSALLRNAKILLDKLLS